MALAASRGCAPPSGSRPSSPKKKLRTSNSLLSSSPGTTTGSPVSGVTQGSARTGLARAASFPGDHPRRRSRGPVSSRSQSPLPAGLYQPATRSEGPVSAWGFQRNCVLGPTGSLPWGRRQRGHSTWRRRPPAQAARRRGLQHSLSDAETDARP